MFVTLKEFIQNFESMLIDYIRFFHNIYDLNSNEFSFDKILNETNKIFAIRYNQIASKPCKNFVKTETIVNNKILYYIELVDKPVFEEFDRYKFILYPNRQRYKFLDRVRFSSTNISRKYFIIDAQISDMQIAFKRYRRYLNLRYTFLEPEYLHINLGNRYVTLHVNNETQKIFLVPHVTKIPFVIPVDNENEVYELEYCATLINIAPRLKFDIHSLSKKISLLSKVATFLKKPRFKILSNTNNVSLEQYTRDMIYFTQEIFNRYKSLLPPNFTCEPLVGASHPDNTIMIDLLCYNQHSSIGFDLEVSI